MSNLGSTSSSRLRKRPARLLCPGCTQPTSAQADASSDGSCLSQLEDDLIQFRMGRTTKE